MLTIPIQELRRNLATAIENEKSMKTFSKTQHSAENELVEFLADSAVVANLKKTLKSFASVPDGHIVHFYKYAGATKVRIVEPETKQ